MTLTARRLNRATLARQSLLERSRLPIAEAVRRAVALQAQEPASPHVALWNRVSGFEPGELNAAYADGTVVRATLMRITLHSVHCGDYHPFYRAMLPNLRAARLHDRRYTAAGLTAADADAVLGHLVEAAVRPLSKDEIEELLADRLGGSVEPRLWWALRTFAPLVRAPTGGPWGFDRAAAFLAAPHAGGSAGADHPLGFLIRRYLEGFGPASAADIAQFALQRRSEIDPALESMAGDLVAYEGPEGDTLYDVPGGVLPEGSVPAPPRLLGMWDSVLLAYRDRRRVIPEEWRRWVIRRNGDVLPTLLIDGYVAGVWRPLDGGIEVTAFGEPSPAEWDLIGVEAEDLAGLLRRDPAVYGGRYSNWWAKLPEGETRMLAG